jgi:hypothetical protein
MTDQRFTTIPASEHYPGLVKSHIQGNRCIQIMGSGPELQRMADELAAQAREKMA